MQLSILLCLIDIAAGMSYLHSIGLLHSDLKGGNVLLIGQSPDLLSLHADSRFWAVASA